MNILTEDYISIVPYILLFGVLILGIFIYKKKQTIILIYIISKKDCKNHYITVLFRYF